jgi:diguanylate cyclase (GGDEF)-like protein
LDELAQEVDRAHRTTHRLVAVYIDVVGLKAVNDAAGHAAGDELLRQVVRTLRARLRTYDLIVRLGGDEFLCVMSEVDTDIAERRFDAIRADLAESPAAPAIRFGIATLLPGDTADALVKRADDELPPGSRH